MKTTNRRKFMAGCLGGAGAAILGQSVPQAASPEKTAFATRGVVLVPEDLTLKDWPERAKRVGLSTIGIHHQNSPAAVVQWVKSDMGQRFLEQCGKLGLNVEYELHAMKELLPRSLFGKNPERFRMNDKGERTPDVNCCVHSDRTLEIIGENAVAIARILRPTTGRYFYWGGSVISTSSGSMARGCRVGRAAMRREEGRWEYGCGETGQTTRCGSGRLPGLPNHSPRLCRWVGRGCFMG